MGLFKLLFLIFLSYMIFQLIRVLARVLMFFKSVKDAGASFREPKRVSENNMVKCAKCNLYIPDIDAIHYQGRQYCSQEHAKN